MTKVATQETVELLLGRPPLEETEASTDDHRPTMGLLALLACLNGFAARGLAATLLGLDGTLRGIHSKTGPDRIRRTKVPRRNSKRPDVPSLLHSWVLQHVYFRRPAMVRLRLALRATPRLLAARCLA